MRLLVGCATMFRRGDGASMVRMSAVGFMMAFIPVCGSAFAGLGVLSHEHARRQVCHRRPSPFLHQASTLIENSSAAEELGSSTMHRENYDIVNVDLEDGRDYPIYIGTSYYDQEGMQKYSVYPAGTI